MTKSKREIEKFMAFLDKMIADTKAAIPECDKHLPRPTSFWYNEMVECLTNVRLTLAGINKEMR